MPQLDFAVPATYSQKIAAARAEGARDTEQWATSHPGATFDQFKAFVIDQVGEPPTGDALDRDQSDVRAAVATRDPAHNAQALWIDEYGLFPPWVAERERFLGQAGEQQAKDAVSLLDRAGAISTAVTFAVKDLHDRDRPFEVAPVDLPLLEGVTHVRGGSFPSGHASTAAVQAGIWDHLAPERTGAHAALVDQLTYSRSYVAGHFPSDLATGAYIGAAAAALALARPDITAPERPRNVATPPTNSPTNDATRSPR